LYNYLLSIYLYESIIDNSVTGQKYPTTAVSHGWNSTKVPWVFSNWSPVNFRRFSLSYFMKPETTEIISCPPNLLEIPRCLLKPQFFTMKIQHFSTKAHTLPPPGQDRSDRSRVVPLLGPASPASNPPGGWDQDYIYIYPSYVRETFLYYLTAEDSFWISFKFNFYLFSQEL